MADCDLSNIADGSNGIIRLVVEVSCRGETPLNPTMQALRFTDEDLTAENETVQSNEVRANRAVADVATVAKTYDGELNGELSIFTYDEFLQSAYGNTFITTSANASITITGSAISSTGAFTNSVSGRSFYLKVAGDSTNATNNGVFKVTKTNANAVAVVEKLGTPNWVPVNATFTGTVNGKTLSNGSVRRSFTLEKGFPDVNQFFQFRGIEVGGFDLTIEPAALVTVTFNLLGASTSRTTSTIATTTIPQTTGSVLNAVTSFNQLKVGTAVYTEGLTSLTMSLDNNTRQPGQIGTLNNRVGFGQQIITGEGAAFLTDGTESNVIYDAFVNESTLEFEWAFTDNDGNVMIFTFPKVKISNTTISNEGNNTDVVINFTWQALDSGNGYQAALHVL